MRADADRRARENRVRFGRSKAAKSKDQLETARRNLALNQKKLEDPDG